MSLAVSHEKMSRQTARERSLFQKGCKSWRPTSLFGLRSFFLSPIRRPHGKKRRERLTEKLLANARANGKKARRKNMMDLIVER